MYVCMGEKVCVCVSFTFVEERKKETQLIRHTIEFLLSKRWSRTTEMIGFVPTVCYHCFVVPNYGQLPRIHVCDDAHQRSPRSCLHPYVSVDPHPGLGGFSGHLEQTSLAQL